MGVAVGPGVGVTWVLQPASKATRTRSDKTYLLIFFTSLKEDTTSEAAGQWDGD
jgi:hypothetical protein